MYIGEDDGEIMFGNDKGNGLDHIQFEWVVYVKYLFIDESSMTMGLIIVGFL